MRFSHFSKASLFAAALTLATGTLAHAAAYNPISGLFFQNYADRTIEFDTSRTEEPLTISDTFFGQGQVVFSGDGGTFSIAGAGDSLFERNHDGPPRRYTTYVNYMRFEGDVDLGLRTRLNSDSESNLADWSGMTGNLQSRLVIKSGATVKVQSGYLNAWFDLGSTYNAFLTAAALQNPNPPAGQPAYEGDIGLARQLELVGIDNVKHMTGVASTTLNGSAALDFTADRTLQNSSLFADGRGESSLVALRNLRAGNDHSQGGTRLVLANVKWQHVNLYVDNLVETVGFDIPAGSPGVTGGSIGKVEGGASLYKTGTGTFTFLGDSTLYHGDVIAAGGNLVLRGENVRISSDDDSNTGALANAGYGNTAFGHTLANASSINIAGTMAPSDSTGAKEDATNVSSEGSRQGFEVRYRVLSTTTSGDRGTYPMRNGGLATITTIRENAFTQPEAGTLVIGKNELIRNFQAMFAAGASATDATRSAASAILNAADNTKVGTPIIAGTGIGSNLGIHKDAILAIRQDEDAGGIYKGTISGLNAAGTSADPNERGGTIVKYGKGALALILEGANYSELVIAEGMAVVNITALNLSPGSYDWTQNEWREKPGVRLAAGTSSITPSIVIIENDASTLKTRLEIGDGAELRFSTYKNIRTLGGEIDAGSFHSAGYIEVKYEQRFVTGDVIVQGGQTLRLSATDLARDEAGNLLDINGDIKFSGGVFGLANSIIVFGLGDSTNNQLSRIELANTNQKINNLAGDSFSSLNLGTGTMTLDITSNAPVSIVDGSSEAMAFGTFNGGIQGNGSIYKFGTGALTLGGGSNVLHFGATVIAEGAFATTHANTLTSTSALVLNRGLTGTLGGIEESINALYGFNDTVVSQAGTLTLGLSAHRTATLSNIVGREGLTALNWLGSFDDLPFFDWLDTDTKVKTFLAPIKEFVGKQTALDDNVVPANRATHDVLTQLEFGNLENYFSQTGLVDYTVISRLFGKTITARGEVAMEDLTRFYLTLLAKSTFQQPVDTQGNLLAVPEMISRLAFEGSLIAGTQLNKVGVDRVTLAGTLATQGIRVQGGTLEIDYDTLLPAGTVGTGTPPTITVAGTVANGIEVAKGATFAMNTAGVPPIITSAGTTPSTVVLNEFIFGRGNFEKKGAEKLILGENVLYSGETKLSEGELQMTLRGEFGTDKNGTTIYLQEKITTAAGTKLILDQANTQKTVSWSKELAASGSVEKIGAGTLELAGTVAIAQGVTVSAGKLIIRNFSNRVSAAENTIHIAENAAFEFNCVGPLNTQFDGNITGTGMLVKSGAGTIVFSPDVGTNFTDFAGTLEIADGTIQLGRAAFVGGEDVFKNAKGVAIAATGTLDILANQTLNGITGDGTVIVSNNSTLTLNGTAESLISAAKTSGFYLLRPENWQKTVGVLGGNITTNDNGNLVITGTGATALVGTIAAGIEVEVAGGQLVVSADGWTSRTIDVSATGEVIFYADANESTTFTGTLRTGMGGKQKIGKIGAGTVVLNAADAAGNELIVYEGELAIAGAVTSDSFELVTLVKGTTLSVALEDNISDIDLSFLEGSGTLALSISGTVAKSFSLSADSMLTPTASATNPYFNGILSIAGTANANFSLEVNGNGNDEFALCSLEANEWTTVSLNASNLKIYQEHDTTIAGDFGSTDGFTITGAGRLAIANKDATVSGVVFVDNGNLQFDAASNDDWVLDVAGDSAVYFAATGTQTRAEIGNSSIRQKEKDGQKLAVNSLKLIKTGTEDLSLDFVAGSTQARLTLAKPLWDVLTAGKLVLGTEQGNLVLSGLENIDAKVALSAQSNYIKTETDALTGTPVVSFVSKTLEDYATATGTFLRRGIDTTGTIVADVAAAGSHEILARSISGAGNFAKTGAGDLTVSANQNYWGATSLATGTTRFAPGVSLETSALVVESGATLAGGVTLLGGTVLEKSTRQLDVDEAAGRTTETIITHKYRDGILFETIKETNTRTKKIDDVDTPATRQADRVVHTGGDFVLNGNLELNVDKGEAVSYSGTITAGTGANILLSGTGASVRGMELKIFEAIGTGQTAIAGTFVDAFSNSSLPLMLIEETPGSISAYVVQKSFTQVAGLELHDGIAGTFTAVLDRLAGGDEIDPSAGKNVVFASDLAKTGTIGIALNKTSSGELAGAIANLSPLSLASLVAMPVSGFSNDITHISNRMMQRRYDLADVERQEGPEFFALAQTNLVSNSKGRDNPTFDFNTYGMLAGIDIKLGEDVVGGFSLAYDRGDAKIHNQGGKITMDDLRAGIFASTILGDGTFYLDAGAQLGVASYDLRRQTVTGTNKGDTDGVSAGLFVNVGKGIVLDPKLHLTPFVGLAFMHNAIDGFTEKTGDSALRVDDFSANSLRGRLGIGLQKLFVMGDWDCRFTLDVAYAHEFLDDSFGIDAAFADARTGNKQFSVDAAALPEDALSIAPSLNIYLSDKTTLFMGYTFEVSLDSRQSHHLNIGFRKNF